MCHRHAQRRTLSNIKTFSNVMTFSKVRAAAALLPVPRKHSCLSMLEGQHGKHACCPSHPLLVRAKTRQCCALSRSRCSGTPCNSWLLATCLETALRQSKEACLCWRGRRGESQGSSTFRWRRILLENSSKKQLSATVPWQRHATIHMRQTWDAAAMARCWEEGALFKV